MLLCESENLLAAFEAVARQELHADASSPRSSENVGKVICNGVRCQPGQGLEEQSVEAAEQDGPA